MKGKILLIGGFLKTKALAESLYKKKYNVTIINNDHQHCLVFAEMNKYTVIQGDGTRPFILDEAGAQNMDIAIALTHYDYDNLVICELCKKKFGVKKTVTILNDPKKMDFFYKMGVDSVVCVTNAISGIIEQQAFLEEISTLIPIGDGRINIAEVLIPMNANAVGKKLWEIDLPSEVIIGCILRDEINMVPSGDTRIVAGDILILISSNEQGVIAMKELTKSKRNEQENN